MAITPVELRHVRLGRSALGYRRSSVDRLLADVADSFENVWRDRADLGDKIEQLEQELVRFRDLEHLLRATLVSAERAAHELRDHAKREADLIVEEAHTEARSVTQRAAAERERLAAESRAIRIRLQVALESLGEPADDGEERRPEAA